MATRIQLRRDTVDNWEANDPILEPGELAISTDLNKIKIGNGSAWSAIGYFDADKAPLNSPALTGTPTAPTATVSTNTTQIATTEFVLNQANDVDLTTTMNGPTALAGISELYSRADHVHPHDTSKAPLHDPTFTGVPAAPTASIDTNTTQIATTAFVIGQGYAKSSDISSTYATIDSPALTGTPTAPTAVSGTNTTQIATTAFVNGEVEILKTTVDIIEQISSHILELSDAGMVIEINDSLENTITVPAESSVNFPVGSTVDVVQFGTGQTTFVADVGVTIRSAGSKLKLTSQYSGATLYKRGADDWVLIGDLSA